MSFRGARSANPESRDSGSAPCGASRNDGKEKQKRPGFPGRFLARRYTKIDCLGGGLVRRAVDHLRGRRGRADRNVAGLLRLGDLANEVDMEQAVLERGILHHDEVGELE